MSNLLNLLKAYPLVSDQVDLGELAVILAELDKLDRRHVKGDVVEFGCYVGTTSLFLQRALRQAASLRRLYVYDSFEGLPPKSHYDESPVGQQFVTGSLSVAKSQFIHNFKRAALPLPTIKKAWFSELKGADVPDGVALAFLDGDYYDSVKIPLRLLGERLSEGAVIVVDDYQNEALPGAARAVDEWMQSHPRCDMRVQASLAIITYRSA